MIKTDGEGGVWFQRNESSRRYLLPSWHTVALWIALLTLLALGMAGAWHDIGLPD